jgi:hypothetical protein
MTSRGVVVPTANVCNVHTAGGILCEAVLQRWRKSQCASDWSLLVSNHQALSPMRSNCSRQIAVTGLTSPQINSHCIPDSLRFREVICHSLCSVKYQVCLVITQPYRHVEPMKNYTVYCRAFFIASVSKRVCQYCDVVNRHLMVLFMHKERV